MTSVDSERHTLSSNVDLIRPKSIRQIAMEVRSEFEKRTLSEELLVQLYSSYCPGLDTVTFVQQALELFPKLNCGLASLVLRQRLKGGLIIKGSFGKFPHTFLRYENLIVDITSDQFQGPKIHVGKLRRPWSRRRILNGFEHVPYQIELPGSEIEIETMSQINRSTAMVALVRLHTGRR